MLVARAGTLEATVQARLAEQALDLIALALTAGDGHGAPFVAARQRAAATEDA